jgi:hypothetical protein
MTLESCLIIDVKSTFTAGVERVKSAPHGVFASMKNATLGAKMRIFGKKNGFSPCRMKVGCLNADAFLVIRFSSSNNVTTTNYG